MERLRGQFFRWFLRVADTPRSTDFFRAVEEWKKTSFPHLSDTLFVVVTFLFERLLGIHLQSEKDRRRYDGRISPRAIGRRKDFWNRLTIAYRDLRIQEVVDEYKGRKSTGYRALIDTFFTDFEELYSDLLSSDPCEFPGFRISIESALKAKIPPLRHRHRHRHVQRRRGRRSGRRGDLEHRFPGRRVRHGERREILQAAGRLRGAAIARDLLHFVRRHADEGGRRRAVLDGRGERSHHALRARLRTAGDHVRLRRLHRRRAGELRHASARADVLLQRHQHAVRRPDRGAVEPAARRRRCRTTCR